MNWRVIEGDCREAMATFDAASVQTCITSPPYFGLRDYGLEPTVWPAVEYETLGGVVRVDAMTCCLGLEATSQAYVGHLVLVFREVRRVLRDDGTVWLNLGDSFWTAKGNPGRGSIDGKSEARRGWSRPQDKPSSVFKPKDLIGIPWMVAFALRADGWYLRCDVVWEKPNTLPEPTARDRPHRNHEYLFLLSKSRTYYDQEDAVREESEPKQQAHNERYAKVYDAHTRSTVPNGQPGNQNNEGVHSRPGRGGRPQRSVWKISTVPFAGAHFATFPSKLVERCLLRSSAQGDIVLDPFAGVGTTGMVALRHGRSFIGCELNTDYARMARERIIGDAPLLNTVSEMAA